MKLRMTLFAVSAVIGASVAVAEDARPVYVATKGDPEGSSAFTNAAAWKLDGTGPVATEVPNAANDYRVMLSSDTAAVRTPEPKAEGATYTFEGNSLHLGSLDSGVSARNGDILVRNANYPTTITFANEGVYLHYGWLGSWNAYSSSYYGTFHVDATEADPFRIFTSGGYKGVMHFYGPFVGSGYLWIHSRLESGSQAQTDMRCTFHNDALKDFTGTIDSYWCTKAKLSDKLNENGYSQTFITESGSFPGHLRLNCGSKYQATSSDVRFTVNRLTLGNDTSIGVSFAKTSASLLTVADELAVGERVAFRIDDGLSIQGIIDATDGMGKVYECPSAQTVLSAPAGSDVEDRFSVISGNGVDPVLLDYRLAEPQTEDVSGATLLRVEPTVSRVVRMIGTIDGYQNNSFSSTGKDTPSTWSDGLAPTNAETAYLAVDKNIRTDWATGKVDAFRGRMLILYKQSKGCLLECACGGWEAADMRIFGGNSLGLISNTGVGTNFTGLAAQCPATRIFPIRGRIGVASASSGEGNLTFVAYSTKTFDVEAEIYGHGVLTLDNRTQSGIDPADSGVWLHGANTNWFGRILAQSEQSGHYIHLYVSDPRSLGAPLTAWTYSALQLHTRSVLHAIDSFTLDTPNRGIYLSAEAEFAVHSNVTFTCRNRFVRGAPQIKTGAGTFALGGPHAYFNTSSSTVPVENKNRLVIREGSLKPDSDEAFQGLQIEMASGTEITVDVPSDVTSGVGKYGMLDTEWDTPFLLPEEGVTVRVTDPEGATRHVPGRPLVVPVMTVKATAADQIRGKLNPVSPYSDCQARIIERTEGDNITFAVKLDRGMAIILR